MKVSVIIPSRNDRGYLKHAINSVKNQSYKDIELLVSIGDCGVSENINKAIKISSGDIITYFADDDLLPSNAVKLAVEKMGNHSFIHGNAIRFNKSMRLLHRPNNCYPSLKDLINYNHIHGGTCYYRAEVLKNNLFDETLTTGEEYELHLRLLSKGYSLGYINEVLFNYRLHDGQKSIGNMDREYQAKRKLIIDEIKNRYL
jgi:glycosyltransferase involved in cell wall biosynthesis